MDSPSLRPIKRNIRRRHSGPDPSSNPRKKKVLPTLISSVLAVLIISYTMGAFPQVDAFFSSVNQTLQSHNDEAVHFFQRAGPSLLMCASVLGLGIVISGSRTASRRKTRK